MSLISIKHPVSGIDLVFRPPPVAAPPTRNQFEGGLAIGNGDINQVFVSREECRVEVGVLSAKKREGNRAEMWQRL
ncbi:hypothetical protein AKJ16_DCAP15976 [Drosera capensis]